MTGGFWDFVIFFSAYLTPIAVALWVVFSGKHERGRKR